MNEANLVEYGGGLRLFTYTWMPKDDPRAVVLLVHGYGEHAGRYASFAKELNKHALGVIAYDHRGHGRSEGKRGYIESFALLLDDFFRVFHEVQVRWPQIPLLLMGHSMGGLVLALALEEQKFTVNGAVFSSPFLALPDDVPRALLALARPLGRFLPWLPVSQLDTEALSRIPSKVAEYEQDPLVYHGKITARTGAELQQAVDRATVRFEKITVPFCIVHGTADRLAPLRGAHLLYRRAGAEDKTLRTFEGGYHELLNDLCADDVRTFLIQWLLHHV
jgi:alpha-beta hydrolase superfamily lysophospholipase